MKKVLVFFLIVSSCLAQTPLEKLQNSNIGVLIHLGLFTILEGDYQGKDYGKDAGYWGSDWIQINAKIPTKEYADLMHKFNPKEFNAEQWIKEIKNAGVQYVVMMAKHHEGFTLFHSNASNFTIQNSPFKRDIIKELSLACKKENILFGVYYSHSKDWHHRENSRREKLAPSVAYQKIVKTHLTELTQNYPIDFIVFQSGDTYREINSSYAKLVKSLKPDCLVGGRINGDKNQEEFLWKSAKLALKNNQTKTTLFPLSFRGSYGYDNDDNSWRSKKELIQNLCVAIARGSNITYNIGVTPNGTFTKSDEKALTRIGDWIKKNKAAVYNVSPSPFPYDFPFGVVSIKKNVLYAYLLNTDQKIKIDGIEGGIKSIKRVSDNKNLQYTYDNNSICVKKSENLSTLDVIEIEFYKAPIFTFDKEYTYTWNNPSKLK